MDEVSYEQGLADQASPEAEFRAQEAAQARQLREQRVARQRAVQANRNEAPGVAGSLESVATDEAVQVARQAYKRTWQGAQEAVEDFALSLADFFLISGPVTVGLYLIRWIGGNMMSGSFKISYTAPAPIGSVSIDAIPSYSFGDPIDLERHVKFFIIGAITALIYGLAIFLLYCLTHPQFTLGLGLNTIWQIFKNGFGTLFTQQSG